jgi:hypothetical protein
VRKRTPSPSSGSACLLVWRWLLRRWLLRRWLLRWCGLKKRSLPSVCTAVPTRSPRGNASLMSDPACGSAARRQRHCAAPGPLVFRPGARSPALLCLGSEAEVGEAQPRLHPGLVRVRQCLRLLFSAGAMPPPHCLPPRCPLPAPGQTAATMVSSPSCSRRGAAATAATTSLGLLVVVGGE